ncbi:MAG: 16S rRNA (cytosine(1402)-N(4))-methyltransferase RsmH [Deltaproteobacteria bacterium]|nr:16S rRNA (cytosine(1402)-N(4))-methyltransferase RsmH [Deltaproteobacteria bacterium]
MASAGHVPVMLGEVLALVDPPAGAVVLDCTAGAGGHLRAFVERVGPHGRVVALDRDPRAHQEDAAGGVAARHADRVTLVQAPFSAARTVLDRIGVERVDALFADLGVSSLQLDEPARGFSFRADAPLDMRMDTSAGETAAELIRRLDERELADVIYLYGEEHKSRRIARVLKRDLPTTTAALAEAVIRAVGDPRMARRGGGIHPATRTFQALRIATNRELDELDALLGALPSLVRPGGRAVVLSFHSLEDRKVKHRFRDEGFTALTKRPQVPSDDEIKANPRARSAKLRAALVGVEPGRDLSP